ncbi:MAG TPA: hypothetical protein VGN63_16270 [Flavisolibacter sp.]|jgi:hypothetical protein|nr:hypothetical protein [Flavisolibacter sp.]
MSDKTIQEHLFQRIKEILPPGQSLVDTVAEVLCISQDSAYRRIRGETLLVLEEARVLCQQFNFSLDQLLQLNSSSVVFENIKLGAGAYDFKGYLGGILQQIKLLHAAEEKSIFYVTSDLPVFHQFSSPALFAFRYFFWMKTMIHHPDFAQRKFSLHCLTPEIEALGREILTIYNRIPSVEIWNVESINGLLAQVSYCYETGTMNREDMADVRAGIRQMLEHVQRQAEYGRKFLPEENPATRKENFKLFYNRVGLGDNTIMTLHDGGKTLFLNYDALNYMLTRDEAFCNETYQKIQSIMRRSTLISSVSEKQRNIFFNILYAKLPFVPLLKEKMAS